MGRKKARRSTIKKSRKTLALPNRFSCPECNHENVVVCKIDRADSKGTAFCTVCEASHSSRAGHLTSAVDIYTEWIDDLR